MAAKSELPLDTRLGLAIVKHIERWMLENAPNASAAEVIRTSIKATEKVLVGFVHAALQEGAGHDDPR